MEDLDEFFDPADDITKTATFTPSGGNARTVHGQFDNGFVNRFGVVEDLAPQFTCVHARVSGVAHGDALTVVAVMHYAVDVSDRGRRAGNGVVAEHTSRTSRFRAAFFSPVNGEILGDKHDYCCWRIENPSL
jgi:hypothetical protein